MHFDEAAVLAAKLAERIQRLHDARALGPAAAHAAGKRNHRHRACRQGLIAESRDSSRATPSRGVKNIVRADVGDAAADGKAILRQSHAAAAQVRLDLLVLHAVESMGFEQRVETLRAVGFFARLCGIRCSKACCTMPWNSGTVWQAAVKRSSSVRRAGESRRDSMRSSAGTVSA